jgi:hypothetical protein
LKNNGTQGYLEEVIQPSFWRIGGLKPIIYWMLVWAAMSLWSAAMSDDTKQSSKSISGDKLQLDFGKNKFRLDERKKVEPFKQKLPPIPGRVPVEETVPLDEVLNPDQDRKR